VGHLLPLLVGLLSAVLPHAVAGQSAVQSRIVPGGLAGMGVRLAGVAILAQGLLLAGMVAPDLRGAVVRVVVRAGGCLVLGAVTVAGCCAALFQMGVFLAGEPSVCWENDQSAVGVRYMAELIRVCLVEQWLSWRYSLVVPLAIVVLLSLIRACGVVPMRFGQAGPTANPYPRG
jgi:hypothetical protein